jgi:hypothetical protein
LLLRFRGSLFYVVERYQTIAIPDVDCHKDLHRSVQKVCCRKKEDMDHLGVLRDKIGRFREEIADIQGVK